MRALIEKFICSETTTRRSGHSRTPVETLYQGSWGETGLFVLIGGFLLLAMTRPAFNYFFFAENFEYLGQYRTHSNRFWQALLSPTNHIFFRPVFFTSSLPWYYILPLEPWAYHLRNFVFSIINLLLLHRVLARLIASQYARVLAFLFFTLSKIHLTTIGYINIFDSIVSLMLLLATILFFLRYIAERRKFDYLLALLFCFLSIFSKDYGLVIVFVVGALMASYLIHCGFWKTDTLSRMRGLSPLVLMVLIYLALRYAVVGPLPTSDPTYSPQFSYGLSVTKFVIFTSTLGNLSFAINGITGASGLGRWFTMDAGSVGPFLSEAVKGTITRVSWGDAVQYLALVALLFTTLLRGRRAGKTLLFPLIWIAVYIGPTLLTRNLQMYYNYEPLAGVAVLLGICLDRADRRLLFVWCLAMVAIGVNGLVSNYTSLYGWQYVANIAKKAEHPVLDAHRGEPIESFTFVTSEKPLLQFALGSDNYPMLQELMKLPVLQVRYISREELPAQLSHKNSSNLFFDFDNGFAEYSNEQPFNMTTTPTARRARLLNVTCGVSLRAIPNPGIVTEMHGSTTIEWSTGDGSLGRVYVSKDGGPERLFAEGSKSSADANWITNGSTYEFRLYSWRSSPTLIATTICNRSKEIKTQERSDEAARLPISMW